MRTKAVAVAFAEMGTLGALVDVGGGGEVGAELCEGEVAEDFAGDVGIRLDAEGQREGAGFADRACPYVIRCACHRRHLREGRRGASLISVFTSPDRRRRHRLSNAVRAAGPWHPSLKGRRMRRGKSAKAAWAADASSCVGGSDVASSRTEASALTTAARPSVGRVRRGTRTCFSVSSSHSQAPGDAPAVAASALIACAVELPGTCESGVRSGRRHGGPGPAYGLRGEGVARRARGGVLRILTASSAASGVAWVSPELKCRLRWCARARVVPAESREVKPARLASDEAWYVARIIGVWAGAGLRGAPFQAGKTPEV